MKKGFLRFIAVFMIVLVAAVFLPASGIDSAMNIEASALTSKNNAMESSNAKWSYDTSNKTLTISGSGAMPNYSDTPTAFSKYNAKLVVTIMNNTRTIKINSGITSIGNYVFKGFKNLNSVSIPSTVTSIGSNAFRDCTSLASISIPSSVKTIGDGAFRGCTALKSVTIPAAVTTISNNTFYGCSSLSSVNIHDKITSIGENAFRECSSLTSVTVPASVKTIGANAFMSCSALSTLKLNEGVTSIGANAFNSTKISVVTMPYSVKTIGSNAFGTVKITCNYGDPGYTYCQAHSNATAVLRTPELKVNITPSDNGTLIASFYVKNASGLNAANFTISHNADIMPVSKEIVVSDNSTSMSAVAFGEDNTVSIGVVEVREIPFSSCTGECEYKVAEIEFAFADSKHTAEFEFSSSVFMLNNTRYTITPVEATFGEHIYERTVVAPTCTAKGYTTYTCICGDTYNADETAMIPHPYTSEVTTVATCNSTGVRKFTCTECGNTYNETIAVDTANHVGGTELRNVATEDCGNNGYTGDTYCLGCNTKIAGGSVIPATGKHSYIGVVTRVATCNAAGVKTYTCEECFDSYEESIAINADNHAGGTELRGAATEDCGNDGYTGDEYCIGCNTKLSDGTVIPATGEHGYVGVETTAATCNATGIMTYTCEVCFDSYEETLSIDADNHAGGTEIRDSVSGNCIEAGYTGDTYCLGCNTMIEKGKEIDPDENHEYTSEIITPATCNETGIETFTCKVCGKTYTSVIDKLSHTEETIPAVAATCITTGLTEGKKCTVCGEITVAQTEVAATGHDYEATVYESTCTAKGYTEYNCKHCDEKYTDSETDMKPHNYEEAERHASTCTEAGEIVYRCKVCLASYSEMLPLKEHNYIYSIVTTPATCTEKGYTTYSCICGVSVIADETELAEHEEEIIPAVAATCTKTGLAEGKKCSVCDTILVEQTIVPATGHTPELVPGKYPTATETGLTDGEKCSVCEEILKVQEEIPALGEGHVHDYTAFVTAPTCTSKGYTTYTCVCGDTFISDETEMIAHDYTESIIKESTCKEDGEKSFICKTCGNTYTEVIEKLSHREEIIPAVAPTCTKAGLAEGKKCSVCDTILVEQTNVPATGHTSELVPGKYPTATETGLTDGEKCSVCGEILKVQEEIPALGEGHIHDYTAFVTAPTCTTGGYTTYRCLDCGDTYISDEKEPFGHSPVKVPGKLPTVTETGLTEGEKCSVCEEILKVQEEIPALGEGHIHNYTAFVTAPTCTSKGYTTYTCVCGDSYTADETEMIAHDYVETVNKPATCTSEGEKSIICSMCNDTKTEKIPAEGHTFDKGSVKAPTCTAQGYTTYRCEKCDYPEKRDVKAALGHNYGADGKCTRCGATDNSKPAELEFKDNTVFKQNVTDKTVLAMNSGTVAQVKQAMMNSGWEITDANGNKLADDKDLTTGCLLRSADGKQVYAYAILGDVNMDGKVTAADARVALRISAKLDTGTAVMLLAADCDGKERVTAADARIILRVSAKLQSF